MSRKALVVIDIQNDITKHYRQIIDRINDTIDWAFRNTDYPALYSYCKYTNVPSFRTAESIGMRCACEYPDEINGKTHVSVITREEWLNELTENMISWAEDKLGSKEYAGWCLSFIEDALEKSNIIEIFDGDTAKESDRLGAD